MGLGLAVSKMLKHLKEKADHKVPYNFLNFCGEGPAADATDTP
jgi:hypothetical protein